MTINHFAKGLRSTLFTLLSAFALAILGSASTASAHDEMYYPATMCKAHDGNGKFVSDVYFWYGTAENVHNTTHRYLDCPVPYRRTGNPETVNVRVRVRDGASDGAVRMRLCDTHDIGPGADCSAWVSTGVSYVGTTFKDATLVPSTATRWLNVQVELPDIDTQTGYSYLTGYRVCRGGWSGC